MTLTSAYLCFGESTALSSAAGIIAGTIFDIYQEFSGQEWFYPILCQIDQVATIAIAAATGLILAYFAHCLAFGAPQPNDPDPPPPPAGGGGGRPCFPC